MVTDTRSHRSKIFQIHLCVYYKFNGDIGQQV